MSKYVLDSSAVLAVLHEESGTEIVQDLLDRSILSSVNMCEIITKLRVDGITAAETESILTEMIAAIVPFDQNIAVIAGDLVADTRSYGLSLGDRACLATAMHLGLTAVTADKIWSKLKLPVKIKLIR